MSDGYEAALDQASARILAGEDPRGDVEAEGLASSPQRTGSQAALRLLLASDDRLRLAIAGGDVLAIGLRVLELAR